MHSGTFGTISCYPGETEERRHPLFDGDVTDLLLSCLVHQLLCLNASQLRHHLQVHSQCYQVRGKSVLDQNIFTLIDIFDSLECGGQFFANVAHCDF
jgi:hypothetical protein